MLDKLTDGKKRAGVTVGIASTVTGSLYAIDPEGFVSHLSAAAANDVARYLVLFGVAAWIHSSRVKKEIRKSFESVTLAINNVADALRFDLRRVEGEMIGMKNEINKLKEGA